MLWEWKWLASHSVGFISRLHFYFCSGNGFISTQTLREILAALDDKLGPDDLDGIIAEIDTDGSGTVDFDGEYLGGGGPMPHALKTCRAAGLVSHPKQNCTIVTKLKIYLILLQYSILWLERKKCVNDTHSFCYTRRHCFFLQSSWKWWRENEEVRHVTSLRFGVLEGSAGVITGPQSVSTIPNFLLVFLRNTACYAFVLFTQIKFSNCGQTDICRQTHTLPHSTKKKAEERSGKTYA